MMLLRLLRERPHGEAVEGTLSVLGKPLCKTLERASKSIAEGIYPVRVTMSPHFHRLLPLLYYVIGRTGIRIHSGTRPEHSEGCILVAPKDEEPLTRMLLEAQRAGEECYIEIRERDPYPLYDVPYEAEEE
jgi:hypothetical protein